MLTDRRCILLIKLLIALLWLTVLTFFVVWRFERKEADIVEKIENDIFGVDREVVND